MKLSKNTLNTLKNFSQINPSIILNPGNLIMTRAVSGVTYAEYECEDTITDEIGIYDLNGFLSVMSQLGEDSDITTDFVNQTITISNNRATVFLPASDASTIVVPKQRINFPAADIVFELTSAQLEEVVKLSRTVGADSIAITTEKGRVKVKGFSTASGDSMKTLFSTDIAEYEGTNTFNIVVRLANMPLADKTTYKVMVNVKGAVKFEAPNLGYVVAIEECSTHDF